MEKKARRRALQPRSFLLPSTSTQNIHILVHNIQDAFAGICADFSSEPVLTGNRTTGHYQGYYLKLQYESAYFKKDINKIIILYQERR